MKHPSSWHYFNQTCRAQIHQHRHFIWECWLQNADVWINGCCTNTSSITGSWHSVRVCSDIPLPTIHFQYSDQWDTVTKGYHLVKPKQCVCFHKKGIWGSFLMVTVLSDLSDNGRQGSKRAAKALEDWRRVMARKGLFPIINQIHSLEGPWCERAPLLHADIQECSSTENTADLYEV